MSADIQFPQVPFVDSSGNLNLEWFMWLQNPSFLSATIDQQNIIDLITSLKDDAQTIISSQVFGA